jgi:hypothetical protein
LSGRGGRRSLRSIQAMRFCGHLRTTSRHRVLDVTMNEDQNRS